MSSKRLQRNNFSSSKTSSRLLARCLKDVLKTSWKTKNCCIEDVLKTSSRRLEDQQMYVCWEKCFYFCTKTASISKELKHLIQKKNPIILWKTDKRFKTQKTLSERKRFLQKPMKPILDIFINFFLFSASST